MSRPLFAFHFPHLSGRHDIQHNDTQPKSLICTKYISDTSIIDTQHYNIATLLIVAFFAIMLNVFGLSVVMLNVIMLNVVLLNVVILNVVMLIIIMLNVIKLNVIMLNVIKLNVIMLNVVKLNVVMLNIVMLNVEALFSEPASQNCLRP
jgi:hypothetical protein